MNLLDLFPCSDPLILHSICTPDSPTSKFTKLKIYSKMKEENTASLFWIAFETRISCIFTSLTFKSNIFLGKLLLTIKQQINLIYNLDYGIIWHWIFYTLNSYLPFLYSILSLVVTNFAAAFCKNAFFLS